METLVVKVKSEKAAQALAEFLKTIDYVETVSDTSIKADAPIASMQEGSFTAQEKPSDHAGIWKNKKKIDAQKLRKRAWQRKK